VVGRVIYPIDCRHCFIPSLDTILGKIRVGRESLGSKHKSWSLYARNALFVLSPWWIRTKISRLPSKLATLVLYTLSGLLHPPLPIQSRKAYALVGVVLTAVGLDFVQGNSE
jgi:hypothetical protein